MKTVVYLICRPCDDSYYDGSPAYEYDPDTNSMSEHAVAFTTEEAAKAYIDSKNVCEDDDHNAHLYNLYIRTVEVR